MSDSRSGPLSNSDLAPVPSEGRTWSTWHIAALWIGMAVCVPTYQMAGNLIGSGMNWWQALLTIFLGNVIVLIPMTLNAHPGTAYGIPFPVLLRASFGTKGANIAAVMRGLVACGWFGIQTWIGGAAIYATAALVFGFDPAARVILPVLGISGGELLCFLLFWSANVFFIVRGMDSIKWLEAWSAPFLLLVGAALVVWAYQAVGGFAPILSQPSTFESASAFWTVFGASLTAQVGFWATLSLNIPDFSRYAKNQRAQVVGQALGLPPTMVIYSFVGIVATGASAIVFGEAIWDPVKLIAKFNSPVLSVIALLALAIATLSTNIAANVVSPANDFSALAPQRISFKTGGLITAFIGILICPWFLISSTQGYIFTWLIGYGALLGPIAGIMIADYYIIRKKRLDVEGLYDPHGPYRFTQGYSLSALAALFLSVAPNVPGFLSAAFPASFPAASLPAIFHTLYNQAWFIGFALAFGLHLTFRKLANGRAAV
jgi:NCS1 family nucleobase:cation symporter-1